MSFGDPNNPYGPPQGQQQGYGYPQGQQPGYGYPQAPPVQQAYGAGAPMTAMPGNVSAARVMLWVIVGLQVIGAGLFVFYAIAVNHAKNDSNLQDNSSFQRVADYGTGILMGMAVFALAWGVFAAVLAAKFNTGGNGLRITTLVFGIITAVLGLYPFVIVGLVHTVLAILIACFVGGAGGRAWFNRARY
ncbi:hypothetical protein BFF78_16885 [Streptomyces fodineus]|uniref:Uncharacterized protein n=1 Tax=Streptomyces fodineus TaxID=1904616 RepID=A0A1D7YAI0_9ACTN|nr:hypothetical protein [Streptomyces fodineus]AOR32514.1 hypothetical protein BFF78_16885 [Streptomyces fodineus]